MKIAALMAVLVLGSSADQLATVQVSSLRMKVPAVWKKTVGGGSTTFAAPSRDAEFALTVSDLDGRAIDPQECVNKLIAAMDADGKGAWTRFSVGGSPAAAKGVLDASEAKEDDYQTRVYVGCDGRTKWGLTFSMKAARADRFAKLADEVVHSIQYARRGK